MIQLTIHLNNIFVFHYICWLWYVCWWNKVLIPQVDLEVLHETLWHLFCEWLGDSACSTWYGTLELNSPTLNTLRLRQNGHYFADDTFKCIFLNETLRISNKISLKFVPKGPINNIPALVEIMAWYRSGDKPLSEPMMVKITDAYMRHSASMS